MSVGFEGRPLSPHVVSVCPLSPLNILIYNVTYDFLNSLGTFKVHNKPPIKAEGTGRGQCVSWLGVWYVVFWRVIILLESSSIYAGIQTMSCSHIRSTLTKDTANKSVKILRGLEDIYAGKRGFELTATKHQI